MKPKAVFLSGSIDASTNQTFENRLGEILTSGTNKVLLLLTDVKYINSTGLGTIVKCVDQFREKDGDIKLVGVPTKVIALFEMLGLLALFETHDTIEQAVESFNSGDSEEEDGAAPSGPKAQFPIQFKHPVSGMGLNVSQPGRFRDPRSGDFFSIGDDGGIDFYEMSKVHVIDVKLPANAAFASGLNDLVRTLGSAAKLDESVADALISGVDETYSLIAKYAADPNETCNFLIVADAEKLQIGVVNYGSALAFESNEPALMVLQPMLMKSNTRCCRPAATC